MNNEPDYFNLDVDDVPILFRDSQRSDGSAERGVEVWVEKFARALTATDVAHAIAGIIQLYEHPTDDLHGYTKYVPLAESFVRSLGSKSPAVDAVAVQSDPLAGLGI